MKVAGMARNIQIVEAADKVVAFWNGHSRGTGDTLMKAISARKLFAVYYASGRFEDSAEVVWAELEALGLFRSDLEN